MLRGFNFNFDIVSMYSSGARHFAWINATKTIVRNKKKGNK